MGDVGCYITKCKNFAVFLCQYIHSFVFPEMAGRGGATALLATPLNLPLIMKCDTV